MRDDPSAWCLPAALLEHAAEQPDAPFVVTPAGETLSYGEAASDAARVAGFFADLGIGHGDTVAVLAPNTLDYVRLWLGLARLGAVMTALNPDLAGAFLEHQLNDCGARVVVVGPGSAEALAASLPRLAAVRTLVAISSAAEALSDVAVETAPWSRWREATPWGGPLPLASDIGWIMYTSGTTGPAKGVLMPHAHGALFGLGTIEHLGLGRDDRFYVCLPLFHANGLLMQLGATLLAGASAVLRERFSASAWLDDIRRFGCTHTNILGATAAFVHARPPTEQDRDHRLRVVGAAPCPPEHDRAFRERFGVADVVPMYGMTEVNIPLYGRLGEPAPGTCGRVWDRWFEVGVVDPETDAMRAPGEVGEIVVRPRAPFGFMAGYHAAPGKTVEAWRNLWFHTGDAAYLREDGYVVFVDRIKDCIRRRGENISSFELERAILGCPGVREAAAYAVPSEIEGGEDEIMVAVVADPGLLPSDVAAHADAVLPRYARPRFIELLSALPKTPTEKVRKGELRRQGVGPSTWDRERQSAA